MTRYPEIEHIDLVEIDELVVEVCKKYLPKTSCRLDDPRLSIHYEDGVRFVRSCEDKYDLIIVDSTDPFGPGEPGPAGLCAPLHTGASRPHPPACRRLRRAGQGRNAGLQPSLRG